MTETKAFDIEPATLLENLKTRLELPSNWKRAGINPPVTSYKHGGYCLNLLKDDKTKKIAQIIIEVANSERQSYDHFAELVIATIGEISPECDDKVGFLVQLLAESNIEDDACSFEKLYGNVAYRVSRVKNKGFSVTICKI